METVNAIAQLVSTVGFPIGMCGGLFWYMTKQQEAQDEKNQKMMDALNNLSLVISELKQKLNDWMGQS
jgi:preprotein translocase subunit YajC